MRAGLGLRRVRWAAVSGATDLRIMIKRIIMIFIIL